MWGYMGFLDKMSSGLGLFIVSLLGDYNDPDYVRLVVSVVLLGTAVLGCLNTFFVKPIKEISSKSVKTE